MWTDCRHRLTARRCSVREPRTTDLEELAGWRDEFAILEESVRRMGRLIEEEKITAHDGPSARWIVEARP